MKYTILFLALLTGLFAQSPYRSAIIPSKTVLVGTGAPAVSSAAISADTTGVNALSLTFNQSCSVGAGGSSGMTITPSGGAATIGSPTGFPGSTASWPVNNRYILKTESVTWTYVQPGSGIQATAGGTDLPSASTQSATNNSNVLGYDLFNRANSGTLGANWTDVVAGFGVVSNQASASIGSPNVAYVSYGTTPTSNCRMTVTLAITPTTNTSINFQLRDDGSGGGAYSLYLVGTALRIENENSGAILSSNTTSFTVGDKIGFEANGNILTIYKNGVSVLTATDSNFSTAAPVLIGYQSLSGTQTFSFGNFVLQNL